MVALFPQPQQYKTYAHNVDLHKKKWVHIPATSSDILYKRIASLTTQLSDLLARPLHITKSATGDSSLITTSLSQTVKRPQEFTLKINTTGIQIEASDEAGIYYGALAAVQLLTHGDTAIPIVTIRDYPDLVNRGVMLDISRDKVPKINELKQLISTLSRMRINQLQLYIEHTFAFAHHSEVWENSSPLSHDEVLDIELYCREHFIECVPNLNSFGHLERWLTHKTYTHLAIKPEGFTDPWGIVRPVGSTLKPTTASIDFITSLYDEFLPLFSSTYFNVGCDETFELDSTDTYLRHLKKIYREVKKRKKRMMFWGDIILKRPDLIPQIPHDCIALDWGYEADSPFKKTTALFKASGRDFYVCPGTSSWNSITGRSENCIKNIENAAKHGIRNGALGMLITDWGDNGHHQSVPISYLGYCVGAAYGWCLKKNRRTEHNYWGAVIDTHFFNTPTLGLGTLWIALGMTISYAPQSHNWNKTFINQLLFAKDSTTLADIITDNALKKSELRTAKKEIQKLQRACLALPSTTKEVRLACEELLLSSDMATHALEKALHYLSPSYTLTHTTSTLRSRYKKQWLKRNRRGGLHESAQRL